MRRDGAMAGLEVIRIKDFLPKDLIFFLKIREVEFHVHLKMKNRAVYSD